MVTVIEKWGDSQGLRLSRQLLRQANIEVGNAVEVTLKEGVITIIPMRLRGGRSLDDLVSRIPVDYRAEETDRGAPAGKEEW